MYRYPGDPESDDYLSHCPDPQLASLNVIGIVGKSREPKDTSGNNLRSFELKTSVYEGKENSSEYSILCLYPYTPRFKNTPCPNRHALVSVFGQIIGLNETSTSLVLLIDDIVFLSTKGGIAGEKGKEVLPILIYLRNESGKVGVIKPRSTKSRG